MRFWRRDGKRNIRRLLIVGRDELLVIENEFVVLIEFELERLIRKLLGFSVRTYLSARHAADAIPPNDLPANRRLLGRHAPTPGDPERFLRLPGIPSPQKFPAVFRVRVPTEFPQNAR